MLTLRASTSVQEVKQAILEDILLVGKKAGLKSFEQVSAHDTSNQWTCVLLLHAVVIVVKCPRCSPAATPQRWVELGDTFTLAGAEWHSHIDTNTRH